MTQERQPDQRLSRRLRITLSRDFTTVYDRNQCYTGKLMKLWLKPSADPGLRLGVVASRKVGKANVRARAKRLLREAWRLNRFRVNDSYDVILSARSGIVGVKRQDVEKELLALAEKAGIMKRQEPKNAERPTPNVEVTEYGEVIRTTYK